MTIQVKSRVPKRPREESELLRHRWYGIASGAIFGAVMGYYSGYPWLMSVGVGFAAGIAMGILAIGIFVVLAPDYLPNKGLVTRFAVVLALASMGLLWQLDHRQSPHFHMAIYAIFMVDLVLLLATFVKDTAAHLVVPGGSKRTQVNPRPRALAPGASGAATGALPAVRDGDPAATAVLGTITGAVPGHPAAPGHPYPGPAGPGPYTEAGPLPTGPAFAPPPSPWDPHPQAGGPAPDWGPQSG